MDPRDETRRVLNQCCYHKVPATILVDHADTIIHGRFASVSNEAVTFDLFLSEEKILMPPSLCSVTFCTSPGSCVFLAPVQDYQYDRNQPGQLVLDLPSQIAKTEARSVFRMPLWHESGLDVSVWSDDVWNAQPINISLAGILIEFPWDNVPDFSVGAELHVELQLESQIAALAAVVRRRVGSRYGLFFPQVFSKGGIQPPKELRIILDLVERRWEERIGKRASPVGTFPDGP